MKNSYTYLRSNTKVQCLWHTRFRYSYLCTAFFTSIGVIQLYRLTWRKISVLNQAKYWNFYVFLNFQDVSYKHRKIQEQQNMVIICFLVKDRHRKYTIVIEYLSDVISEHYASIQLWWWTQQRTVLVLMAMLLTLIWLD